MKISKSRRKTVQSKIARQGGKSQGGRGGGGGGGGFVTCCTWILLSVIVLSPSVGMYFFFPNVLKHDVLAVAAGKPSPQSRQADIKVLDAEHVEDSLHTLDLTAHKSISVTNNVKSAVSDDKSPALTSLQNTPQQAGKVVATTVQTPKLASPTANPVSPPPPVATMPPPSPPLALPAPPIVAAANPVAPIAQPASVPSTVPNSSPASAPPAVAIPAAAVAQPAAAVAQPAAVPSTVPNSSPASAPPAVAIPAKKKPEGPTKKSSSSSSMPKAKPRHKDPAATCLGPGPFRNTRQCAGKWNDVMRMYSEIHIEGTARLAQGDSTGLKAIVYSCKMSLLTSSNNTRVCGNFGERMSGMASLFLYAVNTSRLFYVDWPELYQYASSGVPGVDWTWKEQYASSFASKGAAVQKISHMNCKTQNSNGLGVPIVVQDDLCLWSADFHHSAIGQNIASADLVYMVTNKGPTAHWSKLGAEATMHNAPTEWAMGVAGGWKYLAQCLYHSLISLNLDAIGVSTTVRDMHNYVAIHVGVQNSELILDGSLQPPTDVINQPDQTLGLHCAWKIANKMYRARVTKLSPDTNKLPFPCVMLLNEPESVRTAGEVYFGPKKVTALLPAAKELNGTVSQTGEDPNQGLKDALMQWYIVSKADGVTSMQNSAFARTASAYAQQYVEHVGFWRLSGNCSFESNLKFGDV